MPRLRRIGQVSVVVLAATVDLLVWSGARDLRGGGTLPFWVVPTLTVVEVYAKPHIFTSHGLVRGS